MCYVQKLKRNMVFCAKQSATIGVVQKKPPTERCGAMCYLLQLFVPSRKEMFQR